MLHKHCTNSLAQYTASAWDPCNAEKSRLGNKKGLVPGWAKGLLSQITVAIYALFI